mgnify:CR=1 FL=1|tara:strand:- start:4105 stop:5523 length:1419 start_codon:yes stop_codon:yes gene_type:complete
MENQIQWMEINELTPYAKNPRNNGKAVKRVAESIKEFGFNQPIVVDKDNIIVVGHTRWKASKELELKEVPVLYMPDDISDEKVKAYRIADNRLNELADWDNDLLIDELTDLDELGFDIDSIGFDLKDMMSKAAAKDENWKSLADQFVTPPFTILDARSGDWTKRKQQWKGIGISSELGRDAGLTMPSEGYLAMNNASTSVFDPVLVEIINLWYSKTGAKVLDPFAGGSVRGVVSTVLGRDYTGIDLRDIQIDANKENWNELSANGFKRLPSYSEADTPEDPKWLAGDSNVVLDELEDESYDLVMTCPPYADLEVYSDKADDISNMDYKDFLNVYTSIINKSAAKLKNDSFMVIVVGDVRDKDGAYRDFVGDTVQAARDAGLIYYNEIIYITPTGTSGMMARRPFLASRKSRKHHQNVLVFNKVLNFVKGDPKKATANAGTVVVDPLIELETDWERQLEVDSNLSEVFNLAPE